MSRRFLTLDEVADELSTSHAQVYALVRSGALEAIKIGGRGQWRVERDRLERYIARCYAETQALIRTASSTATSPTIDSQPASLPPAPLPLDDLRRSS